MWTFIVVGGPHVGLQVNIPYEANTTFLLVGRVPTCQKARNTRPTVSATNTQTLDLPDDKEISSTHAIIDLTIYNAITLLDNNSTNGTRLETMTNNNYNYNTKVNNNNQVEQAPIAAMNNNDNEGIVPSCIMKAVPQNGSPLELLDGCVIHLGKSSIQVKWVLPAGSPPPPSPSSLPLPVLTTQQQPTVLPPPKQQSGAADKVIEVIEIDIDSSAPSIDDDNLNNNRADVGAEEDKGSSAFVSSSSSSSSSPSASDITQLETEEEQKCKLQQHIKWVNNVPVVDFQDSSLASWNSSSSSTTAHNNHHVMTTTHNHHHQAPTTITSSSARGGVVGAGTTRFARQQQQQQHSSATDSSDTCLLCNVPTEIENLWKLYRGKMLSSSGGERSSGSGSSSSSAGGTYSFSVQPSLEKVSVSFIECVKAAILAQLVEKEHKKDMETNAPASSAALNSIALDDNDDDEERGEDQHNEDDNDCAVIVSMMQPNTTSSSSSYATTLSTTSSATTTTAPTAKSILQVLNGNSIQKSSGSSSNVGIGKGPRSTKSFTTSSTTSKPPLPSSPSSFHQSSLSAPTTTGIIPVVKRAKSTVAAAAVVIALPAPGRRFDFPAGKCVMLSPVTDKHRVNSLAQQDQQHLQQQENQLDAVLVVGRQAALTNNEEKEGISYVMANPSMDNVANNGFSGSGSLELDDDKKVQLLLLPSSSDQIQLLAQQQKQQQQQQHQQSAAVTESKHIEGKHKSPKKLRLWNVASDQAALTSASLSSWKTAGSINEKAASITDHPAELEGDFHPHSDIEEQNNKSEDEDEKKNDDDNDHLEEREDARVVGQKYPSSTTTTTTTTKQHEQQIEDIPIWAELQAAVEDDEEGEDDEEAEGEKAMPYNDDDEGGHFRTSATTPMPATTAAPTIITTTSHKGSTDIRNTSLSTFSTPDLRVLASGYGLQLSSGAPREEIQSHLQTLVPFYSPFADAEYISGTPSSQVAITASSSSSRSLSSSAMAVSSLAVAADDASRVGGAKVGTSTTKASSSHSDKQIRLSVLQQHQDELREKLSLLVRSQPRIREQIILASGRVALSDLCALLRAGGVSIAANTETTNEEEEEDYYNGVYHERDSGERGSYNVIYTKSMILAAAETLGIIVK